jgi:uncharacterized flavoprotein (TIGR03862 family)
MSDPGNPAHVVVIGGGPAGLMAAERLSAAGLAVTLHDRMPSLGRKLLMAGRGGLNLTHSEALAPFLARYGAAGAWLRPILAGFPPASLVAWAEGLGQPTFVGSSGRIFPKAMKASPLLRAWIRRLEAQGVRFRLRSAWRGWTEVGDLVFRDAAGETTTIRPDATVLALGGASWPRLGSDGAWTGHLAARGVSVAPLRPANCGVTLDWSPSFRARFAGQPLKPVALSFAGRTIRGEALVTGYGLEGGAIYALSSALREALAEGGRVVVQADLAPDLPLARLAAKLDRPPRGQSVATFLRKSANLSPVAVNLLREAHGVALAASPSVLAGWIKATPLLLTGTQPLDRAISTAGGVDLAALDDDLMLRALPGVFVAGEMLDWEAPTGGYLLQAVLATGRAAAEGVLRRLAKA